MRRIEKKSLRAVYDGDVPMLLSSLGLAEEVEKGTLHCACCDVRITEDNFGGILRKNGQLNVFCDKIRCYLHALRRRHE